MTRPLFAFPSRAPRCSDFVAVKLRKGYGYKAAKVAPYGLRAQPIVTGVILNSVGKLMSNAARSAVEANACVVVVLLFRWRPPGQYI